MNRFRIVIFLPAAALICAADLLPAQRTFVSAASGNDTNPCSRALPCRNFAAAIAQTDPDGEVIVLDSGGYGAVNITQAVSLISPSGVYAGITAFSGNAVDVNANATDHVVLRNLYLASLGASQGIRAWGQVGALYIENCVVSRFSSHGISFIPTTPGAHLYVSDTTVRGSFIGIFVAEFAAAGLRATIDSTRTQEYHNYGIYITSAQATIRESVTSNGVGSGIVAGFIAEGSKVMIENSVSTRNGSGFYGFSGAVMTMTRCMAFSNSTGVVAQTNDVKIYVSDSTITGNAEGVKAYGNSVILSRGNNTLQENTANGSFSAPFDPD